MADLNEMTNAERSAAMRGGMEGWGQYGGAAWHIPYAKAVEKGYRRLCQCGCRRRATHYGCANGVVLREGCELSIRRWVRKWEVIHG